MSRQGHERNSGQDIVYLTHTHSGTIGGMTTSSAAPLSQPGNMGWIREQYPIHTVPMRPVDRLLRRKVDDSEFSAGLERSLIAHADVWARLAEL